MRGSYRAAPAAAGTLFFCTAQYMSSLVVAVDVWIRAIEKDRRIQVPPTPTGSVLGEFMKRVM